MIEGRQIDYFSMFGIKTGSSGVSFMEPMIYKARLSTYVGRSCDVRKNI